MRGLSQIPEDNQRVVSVRITGYVSVMYRYSTKINEYLKFCFFIIIFDWQDRLARLNYDLSIFIILEENAKILQRREKCFQGLQKIYLHST